MAFTYAAAKEFIEREANFYRIHLLFFTLVPLILSGIFYAANGEYHIRECRRSLPRGGCSLQRTLGSQLISIACSSAIPL